MNLSTTYLGLKLKSPIVPSAGPLSQEISNIKLMEDAGAGAVVLYSLFEEQLEHESLRASSSYSRTQLKVLLKQQAIFRNHLTTSLVQKNILIISGKQKKRLIFLSLQV